MSALRNILSKDPSSKWPESFQTPMFFELSGVSLNNIKIGEPYEKLRALGRPDNRNPFKQERFIYYKLGLETGGENNLISYFAFFMQDELKKYKPCQVMLSNERGTRILLYKDTIADEIISLLGIPETEETLHGDQIYHYKYRAFTLEFTFNKHGLIEFEVESAE